MADNNSVDDFFNKKKKKTSKKNKKTMLTAADLLKETEEPREIENQPKDQVNRESQVSRSKIRVLVSDLELLKWGWWFLLYSFKNNDFSNGIQYKNTSKSSGS